MSKINNLVIFGDSYSTHKDFLLKDHTYYYSTEGRAGVPVSKMLPDETWWGRFIKRTEATLVLNDSWSGSTIGYTGYSGADCSTRSSFIYRYRQLKNAGFFDENQVDTILVFGGTNDSWANAPLGEQMLSDWKENDLYSVLPAICYFMSQLKKDHPKARIAFIANCGMKPEIITCIKSASEIVGVEYVELSNIDKLEGHPTVQGMAMICDQVIEQLNL